MTILDRILWIEITRVGTFWVVIILGGNFPGGSYPGANFPGGIVRVGVILGRNFPRWEFFQVGIALW